MWAVVVESAAVVQTHQAAPSVNVQLVEAAIKEQEQFERVSIWVLLSIFVPAQASKAGAHHIFLGLAGGFFQAFLATCLRAS